MSPPDPLSRRHRAAFAVSNFAVGPAFAGHLSYVLFQIQAIGFAIGHEPGKESGSGCPRSARSCRVPMLGSGDVNLTSFMLYLNAIAYAVAGVLIFVVAGVGDHLPYKREQYIFFVAAYGALCLPVAGVTSLTLTSFHALAGIHVVFAVVGYLHQVYGNIYVPFSMRRGAAATTTAMEDSRARQLQGLRMCIAGFASLNLSLVVFYSIVLGLTHSRAPNVGLSMTTAAGATCILLALAAWRMLPSLGARQKPPGTKWWKLPGQAFSSMLSSLSRYPAAVRLLIAYTVYNDTHFAFGTVTRTLFNLVVRPSVREFTGYSMLGPAVSLVVGVSWLRLFPRCRVSLRHSMMAGFSVAALIAIWALIGIAPGSSFGLKRRWEFYAMSVIESAAGAIIVPSFRVLFSQLFPAGSEVRYFGFQMVLSCGTNWIPQVVNGPIVDATDNARIPAAVCLPAFLFCILMAWWTDDERGIALVEREQAKEGGDGEPAEPHVTH